jgi:hypothetical protein
MQGRRAPEWQRYSGNRGRRSAPRRTFRRLKASFRFEFSVRETLQNEGFGVLTEIDVSDPSILL